MLRPFCQVPAKPLKEKADNVPRMEKSVLARLLSLAAAGGSRVRRGMEVLDSLKRWTGTLAMSIKFCMSNVSIHCIHQQRFYLSWTRSQDGGQGCQAKEPGLDRHREANRCQNLVCCFSQSFKQEKNVHDGVSLPSTRSTNDAAPGRTDRGSGCERRKEQYRAIAVQLPP